MKIGYFADGKWGYNTFIKLLNDNSINVSFLTVRYDTQDKELINLANEYNIPIVISQNINSNEFINSISKYNVDLFVSMSFNQIFKSSLYELPKLKTINCHAGKLPFYRGRNVLNWVLINDEKEFGISVHYIDDGIDTGDIILQKVFPITDDDNYNTLLNRAYVECANILYDAIKLIQNKSVKIVKQKSIDEFGTYYGIRKNGDEIIDWNHTTREIYNFIRALTYPGPLATTFLNGKVFKIVKAKMYSEIKSYIMTCGQIIGKNNSSILVKTKDTFIEIIEYIYDGKVVVGDRFNE